jgi:ABC-type amino acid transport substrate-binding protein
MYKLLIALTLASSIFFTYAQENSPDTIKRTLLVASHQSLYPYSWIKKDKSQGIAIDFINYIANKEKLSINYLDIPWKRAFIKCAKGELDILSAVIINDTRSKQFIISEDFSEIHWQIFSDKKIENWKSLDTLKGVGIAGVNYDFGKDISFNQEKIERVKNGEQMVQLLVTKRVNYFVGAVEPYEVVLKQNGIPNLYNINTHLQVEQPVGMVFCKNSENLKPLFDKHIKSLKSKGMEKDFMQKAYDKLYVKIKNRKNNNK